MQGHSIEGLNHDSIMRPIYDPKEFEGKSIVHGSYMQFWDAIRTTGLKAMSRNHIHFAIGYPGDQEVKSGMRNDCDLFIEMDLKKILHQGIPVYFSINSVILTPGIYKILSPIYFKAVYQKTENGMKLIFTNENFDSIKYDHCYKYLFVLDFEANCKKDERIVPQEIIEFPIVPVDVKAQKVLYDSVFHSYVTPTETKLTEFCTELTGITESLIGNAGTIKEVLQQVQKYIIDLDIDENDFCFVTCGDFDFRCLKREAEHKKLDYPDCLKRYINIKDIFRTFFSVKGSSSMTHMLDYFKLNLDGKHHSGIDDSKNIAKILMEMLNKGCLITKAFTKTV